MPEESLSAKLKDIQNYIDSKLGTFVDSHPEENQDTIEDLDSEELAIEAKHIQENSHRPRRIIPSI